MVIVEYIVLIYNVDIILVDSYFGGLWVSVFFM